MNAFPVDLKSAYEGKYAESGVEVPKGGIRVGNQFQIETADQRGFKQIKKK